MTHYLTAVDLPQGKLLLLKSYLTLMQGKVQGDWEYRDSGPVDVHVVYADSDRGQTFLSQATGLCVAYGHSIDKWRTQHIGMEAPIRTAGLMQALNQARGLLLDRARQQRDSAAVESPLPSKSMGSVLRELIARDVGNAVLSTAGAWIAVDFRRRKVQGGTKVDAASCVERAWVVEKTGNGELPAIASERPLSTLLWTAGMAETRTPVGAFRMKRWPDFGALPHRPTFIRAAAILGRHASTVEQIVHSAGLPADDVTRFINAGLLSGCVEKVESGGAAASAQQRSASKWGGLVGRIRQRLGL